MPRTISLVCTTVLLLSACSHLTSVCSGSAALSVSKLSSGTVAINIAKLEWFDDGCVRYVDARTNTNRCVCGQSLRDSLSAKSIDTAVNAMRIAPRTSYDVESISVRYDDVEGTCAVRDIPPQAMNWLCALDKDLQTRLGRGYTRFIPYEQCRIATPAVSRQSNAKR